MDQSFNDEAPYETVLVERKPRGVLAERAAYVVTLLVIFLTPIFFIPPSVVSFPYGKAILIFVGTGLAFFLYAIAQLRRGSIVFPSGWFFRTTLALLAVIGVAAAFSDTPRLSLLGYGFEQGTFAGVFMLFLLMYLIALLFRERDRVFMGFLAFLGSFALLAMYELVRVVFGSDLFAFGTFSSAVSNPVGSWNALGAFFGIGVLFSLITLESLALSRVLKVILILLFVISLGFLALINTATVWIVLGAFALLYVIYTYIYGRTQSRDVTVSEDVQTGEYAMHREVSEHSEYAAPRRVSYYALAVFLIALIFALDGGVISGSISSYFNVNNVEAKPSWSGTLNIARETLSDSPVLGSGPNTFRQEWLLYKPAEVNGSIFWNSDFDYGAGLVPTFLVTSGFLGAAAWLAFLLGLLILGARALFRSSEASQIDAESGSTPVRRYLLVATFIVALYLWILEFVAVPGLAVTALAFIFTGFFIAVLMHSGRLSISEVRLRERPAVGFLSLCALVLLTLLSVGFGYHAALSAYASSYVRDGSAALAEGKLDSALENMLRAVDVAANDIYYRELSELYMERARAAASDDSLAPGEAKARFEEAFGNAKQAIENARNRNPLSYENRLAEGELYASVAGINGAENAYTNALAAYDEAAELNPRTPAVDLKRAELEVARGSFAKAKEHLAEALKKKNNYTDAIFLLAQIQISEGNTGRAINSLEYAVQVSPGNSRLYFQLGVLRYSNKNYHEAKQAFTEALRISPKYANARYFLGLASEKLGEREEAIEAFTALEERYPNNKEVKTILGNLRAGSAPLAGIVKDSPEERETLPIEEEEGRGVEEEPISEE